MRTQTITIYKFDELSDEAKQTAINSNRYTEVEFFEWWDSSFDSFAEAAELFGLDIRQTRKSLVGGVFADGLLVHRLPRNDIPFQELKQ